MNKDKNRAKTSNKTYQSYDALSFIPFLKIGQQALEREITPLRSWPRELPNVIAVRGDILNVRLRILWIGLLFAKR